MKRLIIHDNQVMNIVGKKAKYLLANKPIKIVAKQHYYIAEEIIELGNEVYYSLTDGFLTLGKKVPKRFFEKKHARLVIMLEDNGGFEAKYPPHDIKSSLVIDYNHDKDLSNKYIAFIMEIFGIEYYNENQYLFCYKIIYPINEN
jgi:hypothetical protein